MSRIVTPHDGVRSRYDMSVFERHDLDCGVTAWVQRAPLQLSEEGIFVAYFPKVGSILDPVDKEGLAHFFEHMPFKGTTRFPKTEDIPGALRNVGGSYNASTANGIITYHTSAIAESSQLALDIIADVIRHPLMRPEDVETERTVIQAERVRQFEHGGALARHDANELLYGSHPAFRTGIGTEASINAVSLDDILAFQAQYQHADNLHLVIGGAFSEQPDILARIEEAFSGMARGERSEPKLPALPALEPIHRQIANPRYGRNRFFVEWTLPGKQERATMLAGGLLRSAYAGGMDSPLMLELRDRRGLVYESGLLEQAWIWDIGARFVLNLPIAAEHFDEAWKVSRELLAQLPDERIALQLERWRVDRLTSFGGPISACRGLASGFLFDGRPRTDDEDEQVLDDIDLEDVHRIRDFLVNTPPAIVETRTSD